MLVAKAAHGGGHQQRMQGRRFELVADRPIDGAGVAGNGRNKSSAARRHRRRPAARTARREITVGCRKVRRPSKPCGSGAFERSSSAGELMAPPASTKCLAQQGQLDAGRRLAGGIEGGDLQAGDALALQHETLGARMRRAGRRPAPARPESWSPASTAWHWSGSPCRSSRGSSSRSHCAGWRPSGCPAPARRAATDRCFHSAARASR